MSCKNYKDLSPCSINPVKITIEEAGNMVNIDLSKPIDLSECRVRETAYMPYENYYCERFFERSSKLETFVINEYGEREELTIEFTLKSNRVPKFKQNKP